MIVAVAREAAGEKAENPVQMLEETETLPLESMGWAPVELAGRWVAVLGKDLSEVTGNLPSKGTLAHLPCMSNRHVRRCMNILRSLGCNRTCSCSQVCLPPDQHMRHCKQLHPWGREKDSSRLLSGSSTIRPR